MANVISDETMEYVGILAKLELSDAEKEAAKKDMESMLDYIDKLNELDTSEAVSYTHLDVYKRQSLGMESSVDGCEWKQSPETVTKHLYLWRQLRWRYHSILRNRAFQRVGNYKME